MIVYLLTQKVQIQWSTSSFFREDPGIEEIPFLPERFISSREERYILSPTFSRGILLKFNYFQGESAVRSWRSLQKEKNTSAWFTVKIGHRLVFLCVLYPVISAIHKFYILALFLTHCSFRFQHILEHQLRAKSLGACGPWVNKTYKNPCLHRAWIPMVGDWQEAMHVTHKWIK